MKRKTNDEYANYRELNKTWVSISEVRTQLAQLSMEGWQEIPLGDLLWIIYHTVTPGDAPKTESD